MNENRLSLIGKWDFYSPKGSFKRCGKEENYCITWLRWKEKLSKVSRKFSCPLKTFTQVTSSYHDFICFLKKLLFTPTPRVFKLSSLLEQNGAFYSLHLIVASPPPPPPPFNTKNACLVHKPPLQRLENAHRHSNDYTENCDETHGNV